MTRLSVLISKIIFAHVQASYFEFVLFSIYLFSANGGETSKDMKTNGVFPVPTGWLPVGQNLQPVCTYKAILNPVYL